MNQNKNSSQGLAPRSLLAQGGGSVAAPFGEIVAPIHMSTTYERAADNTYPAGIVYSRDKNPVYLPCERMLCALESGADALLFASGMAAASTVFQALRPGMRVVAPRVMYWGLRQWLIDFTSTWGLRLAFFDSVGFAGEINPDATGNANLAALLREPTDLLWLETPANPTWDITDIAVAARLGHEAGAHVVVDSTVATPVLTRPLELGVDIVMHSATKYLNGHGDVIAGALVSAREDELWARIVAARSSTGAVLGPLEAWLLTRGMRTLHLRVEQAMRSAQAIAAYCDQHRAVAQVLYPGLASHAGHAIAARQMTGGFGAMLSIRFRGGAQAAIDAAARMRVFKRATSLGSTESLVEHRASIEGEHSLCPDDLLRVSVGTEQTDDLVRDLDQAMNT